MRELLKRTSGKREVMGISGCILDLCLEDAIFIPGQLQEKYLGKKENIYFTFLDLEKEFDRVSRNIVRWAMRKLNMDEWLIEIITAMYEFSNSATTLLVTNLMLK